MARLLAIDWDQDRFHIALVNASGRGVVVERALTWALGEELTPAAGEALGRKLRDALRGAGVTPAPVVACIGRDRVVVKELHYPPVPRDEEPALVRFQAAKELSELPDDVVIDYAPLSPPEQPGEREALAVALRKQILQAWLGLCRGLGVKLAALTTRTQALQGALERARNEGAAPLAETVAILAVGNRWAELAIAHHGRILFARALASGAGLAAEVKRSLTLFATGHGAIEPPAVLLFSGNVDLDLEQRLRELNGFKVQRLDPFLLQDRVDLAERDNLAAAVGAAHLWARTETLPINFAAPKQPRVQTSPQRQRFLVYGVAAAILIAAALFYGSRLLSNRNAEISALRAEKADKEELLKKLAQDKADIDGLRDWEETSISWLDELYDLAARFPYQVGFRVKDLNAGPISKRNPKERFVAQVTITGIAKNEQDALVKQFLDSIESDKYLQAGAPAIKNVGNGNEEFTIKIDIAKRPQDKYSTRLTLPARPRGDAAMPAEMTEDDAADDSADPAEKGGQP